MNPSVLTKVEAATESNWPDLEALFGSRGACGGCWCMYWRLTSRLYETGKGASHRAELRKLAMGGLAPGLLGYDGRGPVGWISVGPRTAYPRLGNSRILKPVDDTPVWSIVCLFVDRRARRCGISIELIGAAVDYAAQNGATVVEGYPVEPRSESVPDVFVFTGLSTAFRKAGFEEVARRSETRPVMRRFVVPAQGN